MFLKLELPTPKFVIYNSKIHFIFCKMLLLIFFYIELILYKVSHSMKL